MFKLHKISDLSGHENVMDIPISKAEFNAGIDKWKAGYPIQHAFPQLSSEIREFIMTGITPSEWDATILQGEN